MPLAILLLVCILASCTSIPQPSERYAHADSLATEAGWRGEILATGEFGLLAYAPQHIRPAPNLTVYIEGDGFAWINRTMPSSDPTPREPLALRLALKQPTGNAVYLGRPCQYVDAERTACPERYWQEARFAPEVVRASSKAIDILKERFAATRLTLVGYSGGATVAALLATRRNDVERLITVAGNLDHLAWTTHHRVLPLTASLNPANEIAALQDVRQWHLLGDDDRVIPPTLTMSFIERFPPARRPPVTVISGFTHQCCWADEWENLWRAGLEQ